MLIKHYFVHKKYGRVETWVKVLGMQNNDFTPSAYGTLVLYGTKVPKRELLRLRIKSLEACYKVNIKNQ